MPKYVLPPSKSHDSQIDKVREDYSYPDEWARQITIPANPELVAALEVGGEATITLTGTIQELTSNQTAGGSGRTSLVISVAEVDAYPGGSNSEEADEDFERGFGDKRGRIGSGMPYG